MTKLQFQPFSLLKDKYDLFIFDLAGVLTASEIPFTKQINVVNHLRKEKIVCIMTNSSCLRSEVQQRLERLGIKNIPDENIFSSGEIAYPVLQLNKEKFVIYALGNDQTNFMHEFKTTTDLNQANVVLLNLLVAENEETKNNEIIQQIIDKQLKTICVNPDVLIPNTFRKDYEEYGIVKYGPGFTAKKIETLGGEVSYIGKPYPAIYKLLFDTFPDVLSSKMLMVGDTLETDILGAINNHIDSAIVLTGNTIELHKDFSELHDKIIAIENQANLLGIMPTYVTDLEI